MQLLDDFIKEWSGKKADWNGAYLGECVSLAKRWEEKLGEPIIYGNAITELGVHDEYDVETTGDAQPGDLIIWGSKVGPYGHIAIFVSGNIYGAFTSFDENWPVGSFAHLQNHNNNGQVIGWLRPKKLEDQMNAREVAEALCIVRTGRVEAEADYIEGWINGGKDIKEYAYMAAIDGPLNCIYRAVTGQDNPQSEKDHYNLAFRNGELGFTDYANMKYTNDVKPTFDKVAGIPDQIATAVKNAVSGLIKPSDCPVAQTPEPVVNTVVNTKTVTVDPTAGWTWAQYLAMAIKKLLKK